MAFAPLRAGSGQYCRRIALGTRTPPMRTVAFSWLEAYTERAWRATAISTYTRPDLPKDARSPVALFRQFSVTAEARSDDLTQPTNAGIPEWTWRYALL